MNSTLSKPFTAEEIKAAIFSMNPLGSSGPDGFPAKFYQEYWDTVGFQVCEVALEALNGAFVPGRLITDNIIMAFESLHTMKTRLKGKDSFMALKLDMSKAYDRIEWDFLASVMHKMGFSDSWISLVMKCVTSVTYSLLLSGVSQPFFCPSRGLRQGDPLSPYLFILCGEALNCLLNRAKCNGFITCLPIRQNHLHINHLFFTDDSLLFCKANSIEWIHLYHLLDTYEKASGQRLNKDKTSIFFSRNTREETKEIVTSIAGIRGTNSCKKYLDLPALIGRLRTYSLKGVLAKVQAKLSSWKTKLLSQAGKEILVKVVIQSILTYCMGIFKLPKHLLHDLNKLIRSFWWGLQSQDHKIHWVARKQMNKSKKSGRLGLRDFENFNVVLLAKQCWRILSFPHSLTARVFQEKYFKRKHFLSAKVGYNSSFLWQSFISAKPLLEEGLIWRIGDGKSVTIWNDKWIPQKSTFRPQSSTRFLPVDTKVAILIDYSTNQWKIPMLEALFNNTKAGIIKRIPLSPYPKQDKLIWRCTPTSTFSVKSAYYLKDELDKSKGQSSRKLQKTSLQSQAFKQLVESLFEFLEDEVMIEFAITAWMIWKRRNELVFNKTFMHPNSLIQQAKVFIEEQSQIQHATTTPSTDPRRSSQWEAPPRGQLKLNWDVALNKNNCKVGVGAVIRDWEGTIKATMRMKHDLYPEPLLAKAYALPQASIFCKSLGWKEFILEGDSLQVVNYLKTGVVNDSYVGQ
ncbi:uncharacterized protein LOC121260102 [Juglans microcarpa x Juglans regia]|uniref:uncharacterized protein LOC121260102 n=1 Tax=Juglans microcarpa x Juglans regia TaxID=2249226 RepID=UPI001B7D977E|nr:uncharacterized protein LOC121260102 [Juglans microcarpa x Juglans regia]